MVRSGSTGGLVMVQVRQWRLRAIVGAGAFALVSTSVIAPVYAEDFASITLVQRESATGSMLPMAPYVVGGTNRVLGGAVAPLCPEDYSAALYCIVSLEYESTSGTMQAATFDGYVTDDVEVGEPESGLPASRSSTMWRFPGRPNDHGAETYLLGASLALEKDLDSGMWGPQGWQGQPPQDVGITPWAYTNSGDPDYATCRWNTDLSQAWYEVVRCPRKVSFAEDFKIRLKIVVPRYVGGWFHGRLDQPSVQLVPLNDTSNLLTVEAGTVSVPGFVAKDPPVLAVRQIYPSGWISGSTVYGGLPFGAPTALSDFLENSATSYTRHWNFTQYTYAGGACFSAAGLFQGLVTTNAMQYQTGPLEFDAQSETFKFALSGLRYQPDKSTLFSGTYDLVVRKDVLQCLYGFSGTLGVSAQVSDGATTQSGYTTTITDLGEMSRISLRGFHFSNPTASVAITGTRPTLKTFTSTPTPTLVGVVRVGTSVSASPGGWDGAANLTYQWYVNNAPISGATGSTFTPTASLYGKVLSVRVTGSLSGYRTSTQSSLGKLVGLGANLVSTFGSPTSQDYGFTVEVTNYDPQFRYTVSASEGQASQGRVSKGRLPITVTGLEPGVSAVVTVVTERSGYRSGTAPVTGQARQGALAPTFSEVTREADGFAVTLTNFSADYRYTYKVDAGKLTVDRAVGSSVTLRVKGLRTPGQSATISVTVTKSGFTTVTRTVTGTRL